MNNDQHSTSVTTAQLKNKRSNRLREDTPMGTKSQTKTWAATQRIVVGEGPLPGSSRAFSCEHWQADGPSAAFSMKTYDPKHVTVTASFLGLGGVESVARSTKEIVRILFAT